MELRGVESVTRENLDEVWAALLALPGEANTDWRLHAIFDDGFTL